MSRFNRVALAVIVGLALTIGILSVASARLGPTVDTVTTAQEMDGTSVDTSIQVTFTEPMNPRSVQRAFHIAPQVRGAFNFSGNSMQFTPKKLLRYGTTYTISIDSRALGAGGKHLYRPYRATFTTQQPHLVYLGTQGREKNRLVLASIDGRRRILGPDDGSVTDFSVSLDRSLIVYVRRPQTSGHVDEVWLLSLADGSTNRVFSHSGWDMSAPHISPDNRDIVFLATNVLLCQKYYGCTVDKTGPVIYLLRISTHRATLFQPHGGAPLTYFIDFSPTGQVAYTDLGSALTLSSPSGQGTLQIPNRGNSLEYSGFDSGGDKAAFVGQTPNSSGGDILVYVNKLGGYTDVSRGVYDSSTPSFSTSGQQVAYAGYHGEKGIEPVYGINVYDFATKSTRQLTNEKVWSDWTPQWSSDDQYIAFVRSEPQEAMYMGSGVVWVIKSDGTGAHAIGGIGKDVRWVS